MSSGKSDSLDSPVIDPMPTPNKRNISKDGSTDNKRMVVDIRKWVKNIEGNKEEVMKKKTDNVYANDSVYCREIVEGYWIKCSGFTGTMKIDIRFLYESQKTIFPTRKGIGLTFSMWAKLTAD